MDASDVHLKADAPPFFRVRGVLVESGLPKLSGDDLKRTIEDILPAHLKKSRNSTWKWTFRIMRTVWAAFG